MIFPLASNGLNIWKSLMSVMFAIYFDNNKVDQNLFKILKQSWVNDNDDIL